MKLPPILHYTPHNSSLMDWSNKCVKFLPYSPLHKPSLRALKNPSTTKILITSTSFHIPHLHLGIFAIFYHDSLHISDFVLESSPQRCTISALLHTLRRVPMDNNIISIFYTDKQFPSYITNTYDTPNLDLCTALTNCFDDLLTNSSLVFAGFWFLKAWVGAQTQEWHPQWKEEATMKTIHHHHHATVSSLNGDAITHASSAQTLGGHTVFFTTTHLTPSTPSSLGYFQVNLRPYSLPPSRSQRTMHSMPPTHHYSALLQALT
jgi:hypothetical protein